MICLYHSRDLDGLCSGAIVKRALPHVKLIGYDYGDDLPEISPEESIVMIDVSLPMDKMAELASRVREFIWIDHHVSAINEFNAMTWPENVKAHLRVGVSACELGWEYFFRGLPMPETVQMLGEYDTWRNQDPARWRTVLEFQYGTRAMITRPEDFDEWFFAGPGGWIMNACQRGKAVLAYQEQVNAKQAKNAYEREVCGLPAVVINAGGFNSDLFKTVWNPARHKLMMCWQYDGKGWFTASLYTTHEDVDCSVLAKNMGGGGHRKASGFRLSIEDINKLL